MVCQREPTRCAQPAAAGVPVAKAACQRMDGWAGSHHLQVVQASCCCWQCLSGWCCKLPQTEGQHCQGLQHLLQQGCGRAAETAGGAALRPGLPGRESGCLHARQSPHAPLCCAQRALARRRWGPSGAHCQLLTGGDQWSWRAGGAGRGCHAGSRSAGNEAARVACLHAAHLESCFPERLTTPRVGAHTLCIQ